MVPSIVLTEVHESNQPWFALITKNEPPHNPSAMIVKFVNYVFVIDPPAMSRGNLWIRSFERFYSRDSMASNGGFHALLGELSVAPSNARPFKPGREKIIYPGELATLLPQFPIDDAAFFARAAMHRAYEQLFGTEKQITARERKLQQEITAKERQRASRKRRAANKVTY